MNKKLLFIGIIFILCSCGKNADNKVESQVNENTGYAEAMRLQLFEAPEIITDDDSLTDILNVDIRKMSTDYESEEFPKELIIELEQFVYQMSMRSGSMTSDEMYAEEIGEVGSCVQMISLDEMVSAFPELSLSVDQFADIYDAYAYISGVQNCVGMFRFFSRGGQEFVLFCIDSGGSYGVHNIVLAEHREKELHVIVDFDTQSDGCGKVLKYGEEYYYVYLHYNYNLKNYDGVAIHKLSDNAETQNIFIRLLPQEYIWKTLCSENDEIAQYLEDFKKVIDEIDYLEAGNECQEMVCLYGDEKEIDGYYCADFLNIGVPIYYKKSICLPSNANSVIHLKASFYSCDEENNKINLFSGDEINMAQIMKREYQLVQLWFKEFDGLIYTFQIFHLTDYDYMLNVVLYEGNNSKQIHRELLIPQKDFNIQEGIVWEYY